MLNTNHAYSIKIAPDGMTIRDETTRDIADMVKLTSIQAIDVELPDCSVVSIVELIESVYPLGQDIDAGA